MINPKKELAILDARVKQLMFLCTSQEEKNRALQEIINQKEEEISAVKEDLQEMTVKYQNLKIAHSISSSDNSKKETKVRFDQLVREIDKCIALLNE